MKKTKFLFPLLMAIVMMAISPMKSWADHLYVDGSYHYFTNDQVIVELTVGQTVDFTLQGDYGLTAYIYPASNVSITSTGFSDLHTDMLYMGEFTVGESGWYKFTISNHECTIHTDVSEGEEGPEEIYTVDGAYADLTVTAVAAPETKAVYDNTTSTLTFYYDNETHTGTPYSLNTDENNPGWYENRASITSVVFDASFASAHPTSCYRWFYGCSALTNIFGLEYLNTSEVTNMNGMFFNCSELTSINLDYFNTANVTDMSDMFRQCSKLTSLIVSGFNTTNVTNMSGMFYSCSQLTSLDVSGFNTTNVTNMEAIFMSCSSLTSLDVSGFNTANVTNMSVMFHSCSKLTDLDLSSFNTANVTNMSGMFYNCSGLTGLDLSSFNTANVTDMSIMFKGCSGLTGLDLSSFNTTKVTTMSGMFDSCSKLTDLDLSSFNTAKVTTMSSMFYSCSKLTDLDLSSFNTAKVTTMSSMFDSCSKLTDLDLSSFNTAKVTTMSNMFRSCSGLTDLDLSSFNTANVTTMNEMFQACSGLTSLTIGNFDMQKASSINSMFKGCSALNTLTIKSLPYLRNNTFNTQFRGKTVNYEPELNDNSIIYTGTNYLPNGRGDTADPTYTREMSNAWGTIVLPFDIFYDANNGNYKLYYLSAVSNENLTFTEYEDYAEIPAGTPMAVKAVDEPNSAGKYEIFIEGVGPISTDITPSDEVDGLTMNGTYTNLTNQTGMYFIAQNKFWLADAAITIAPFRAWFEGNLGAGAKTLNIVVDEEADGIASVIGADSMMNGKYIENGHVVIVKNGKKFNLNGQEIK